MLRKVRVYGRLAKFLGRHSFEAEVNSAAEAIRFLIANFPSLEAHMSQQYYKVCMADQGLGAEDLHVEGNGDIRIIPVFVGAGGRGMNIGMILAGVALIALSFVSFGAGAWAGLAGWGTTGAFAAAGSVLSFAVGATLLLTGTAGLLSPTPNLVTPSFGGGPGGLNGGTTTRDTELDPQKSYSFSGIQNTSATGAAVPVVYGETIIGSLVISAGLDTDQT